MNENNVIATVVLGGDGTTFLFYKNGNMNAPEIVKAIENGLDNNLFEITIGAHKVPLNEVWMVEDWITKEKYIINDENKLPTLNAELMATMSDTKLKETMDDIREWIAMCDDEDELDVYYLLLENAIDEFDQRYCNASYEAKRMSNILNSFVNENELNKQFENWILEKRKFQNSPMDKYNVIDELYGDLDELKHLFLWEGVSFKPCQEINLSN